MMSATKKSFIFCPACPDVFFGEGLVTIIFSPPFSGENIIDKKLSVLCASSERSERAVNYKSLKYRRKWTT
jgi:hypothetical protein